MASRKPGGISAPVPQLVVRTGNFLRKPEEPRSATGEQAGPRPGVRLHHPEFLVRQPSRFQQDGVGNRNLSDIVELRRAPDMLYIPNARREGAGEPRRLIAHASCVPSHVVIPQLRGLGEPFQHLHLRILEFPGALADSVLKRGRLIDERNVQVRRADANKDLGDLERLRNEVVRTCLQRTRPHRTRYVHREHHDGKVLFGRNPLLCKHVESIFMRHVEVQEHQVRPVVLHRPERLARIRLGADPSVAGAAVNPGGSSVFTGSSSTISTPGYQPAPPPSC